MGGIAGFEVKRPFHARQVKPFRPQSFNDALTGVNGVPKLLGGSATGQILTTQFEIERAGGDWAALLDQIDLNARTYSRCRNVLGRAIDFVHPDYRGLEEPLPMPGRYEAALWTLAGTPCAREAGFRSMPLTDARLFAPEDAERELNRAGYRGSLGLFLAMLTVPEGEVLGCWPGEVATLDDTRVGMGRRMGVHTHIHHPKTGELLKWALGFASPQEERPASTLSIVGFRPL